MCEAGISSWQSINEMEVFLKVPCSPRDSPLSLVDRMSETGNTDRVKCPGWQLTIASSGLGHTFAEVSRLAVQSLGLRYSDTVDLRIHLLSRHLFSTAACQARGPACR